MTPFTRLDARAAPMNIANVDTDQIIPKQFLKTVEREGLAKGLFYDFRFDGEGREISDFVLNRPEYKGSSVLMDEAKGGNHMVSIDLETQTVISPSGKTFAFQIDPVRKDKMLRGLDAI